MHFIFKLFNKNCNVLWNGANIARFAHDTPVKWYKMC